MGFVGYMKAPGTCASLVAFVCAYWLRVSVSWYSYCLFVALLTLFAYFVIHYALTHFDDNDPQQIVLDEAVGSFIALMNSDIHGYAVIFCFVLFRFFDITKWFGIRACERLPGAFGILADDIVAGLYAQCLTYYIGTKLLYVYVT